MSTVPALRAHQAEEMAVMCSHSVLINLCEISSIIATQFSLIGNVQYHTIKMAPLKF